MDPIQGMIFCTHFACVDSRIESAHPLGTPLVVVTTGPQSDFVIGEGYAHSPTGEPFANEESVGSLRSG